MARQYAKARLDIAGVSNVRDLHVWAMSTADNVLTGHLVVEADTVDRDAFLYDAMETLHEQFELQHVALQCEPPAFVSQCQLNEAC